LDFQFAKEFPAKTCPGEEEEEEEEDINKHFQIAPIMMLAYRFVCNWNGVLHWISNCYAKFVSERSQAQVPFVVLSKTIKEKKL
jgi:hypothetical protein